MPFADLWDFYLQVRAFIDDLAQAGETHWSSALDTAMYGSTSGEILTYLLLQLQRLRDTGVPRWLREALP